MVEFDVYAPIVVEMGLCGEVRVVEGERGVGGVAALARTGVGAGSGGDAGEGAGCGGSGTYGCIVHGVDCGGLRGPAEGECVMTSGRWRLWR